MKNLTLFMVFVLCFILVLFVCQRIYIDRASFDQKVYILEKFQNMVDSDFEELTNDDIHAVVDLAEFMAKIYD